MREDTAGDADLRDDLVMKPTSRYWSRRPTLTAGRLTGPRRDTHRTHAQSPLGIGIDAQMPNSMPRSEDDVTTRAGSRDFHDQPGSGADIANRASHF